MRREVPMQQLDLFREHLLTGRQVGEDRHQAADQIGEAHDAARHDEHGEERLVLMMAVRACV